MMNDAVALFREEAREHLETLEQTLLVLETDPFSGAHVDAAFRAMHTIKGAAGMVGFNTLCAFAHHFESFLEQVRAGALRLQPAQVSVLLAACDHIGTLLAMTDAEAVEQATAGDSILARLEPLAGAAQTPVYTIHVLPDADTFRRGLDVLPVLREITALGPCEVKAQHRPPEGGEADPESCRLSFVLELQTERDRTHIEDAFLFVSQDWEIQIEAASPGDPDDQAAESVGSPDGHEGIAGQPAMVGEGTVRVAQGKLDALVDQVGELVILQARLERLAITREDEALVELAERLGRLGDGLRETAFEVRMLPIGAIFSRFRRLARDLADSLGKEVEFETFGGDTELDKAVIDRLADPLVHLVRNSLDHGIEPPGQRLAAGKSARGRIRLRAEQRQGQVLVTLEDDGAGLDRAAILARAIERGVMPADACPDEATIDQLIFAPGFSTVDRVSDISGRGVGMDAVRRSVEALRGRIRVWSRPGEGTLVEISLPMTLAIIDGLMVTVNDQRYVLPLDTVEACVETTSEVQAGSGGARLLRHMGEPVPCLRLRECFGVPGTVPAIEQTVLVRIGSERLGITVDQVVGNFQTVIKSLGALYRGMRGLVGATITGDGEIAMILDVGDLIREATS
ncbi:MAG: chemotaxis protein CheA [Halothiobacillaceae bacterium]